jgi:hypothetical protein
MEAGEVGKAVIDIPSYANGNVRRPAEPTAVAALGCDWVPFKKIDR